MCGQVSKRSDFKNVKRGASSTERTSLSRQAGKTSPKSIVISKDSSKLKEKKGKKKPKKGLIDGRYKMGFRGFLLLLLLLLLLGPTYLCMDTLLWHY